MASNPPTDRAQPTEHPQGEHEALRRAVAATSGLIKRAKAGNGGVDRWRDGLAPRYEPPATPTP